MSLQPSLQPAVLLTQRLLNSPVTHAPHCWHIISYQKFIVRPLLREPRQQVHYKRHCWQSIDGGIMCKLLQLTRAAFTARRYASAVYALVVCLSVRHKPVLYRSDWTNRAGIWHEGFLLPIPPHCVIHTVTMT